MSKEGCTSAEIPAVANLVPAMLRLAKVVEYYRI
jgi:hypothetical protein